MPRHDVAIYMPHAAGLYDATQGYAGGAELQTILLARELQARGLRTAHIVYPVNELIDEPGLPTVLTRPDRPRSPVNLATEPALIWRAMARADARLYVFRTAHVGVGFGAAWCRVMRRRFLFAAANDSDFTLSILKHHPFRAQLYRRGAAAADAMVVQSAQQVELAHRMFPSVERVIEIPSFVQEAAPAGTAPDSFLWATRLADYKRPLAYLDLASAVPEASFRMIAVSNEGDTRPELEAEVRQRAAELPNVELLPRLSRQGVLQELERAVAVVNTSETEGMPNVFLEGWARGVPALTFDFDPDRRIARHGLGISAGGDWDTFVAGTRQLWARRADRGGFGPATRAYIEATHGRAAVGGAWTRFIQDLL